MKKAETEYSESLEPKNGEASECDEEFDSTKTSTTSVRMRQKTKAR